MSDAAFLPPESLMLGQVSDSHATTGRADGESHWAFRWLTSLSLGGFALVSFLPDWFGQTGRTFTVPFRALVLLLGLSSLVLYRKRFITSRGFYLFIAFWALYTARILWDTVLDRVQLMLPADEYWLDAFGIALIPALVFCVKAGDEDFLFLRRFLMTVFAVVSALSLAFGDLTSGGRLAGNTLLNPITNGHIAASLMLLCIYYLFGKKKSVVGIVFAACCIPLGFVTLLAANSRGPIVCMVISLSLFWFAGLRGKARIVVLALGFLFGVAFPTVTAMLQDKGESDDIMSRFDKLNDQGSLEQESRYFTYAAAWAGYIENPVFGYRLELPSADVNDGDAAYPHNIVLESLMTTGTLGGILLIALLTAATGAAWRLLRGQHPNNWVALLFVQYLFAAMFSGGIYNDAELWQYSLAVFALDKVFSSQSVQTHE